MGLLQSAYLLARDFAVLSAGDSHLYDLCSALFSASCDGALADERFWFLGVPAAGWGLVYFVALAGLLILGRFVRGGFEPEAYLAASLLAGAGLLIGLFLLGVAWLTRTPLCPLCLSVHAVSLLLLLTLHRAAGRPFLEEARTLRAAASWFVQRGTSESARWKLVAFGSVALMAAMTYQWVYVEAGLRRPRPAPVPDRAEVIAAYRASPLLEVPVGEDDPRLGSITAPVQLVVFESFRCSACQRFATTVSRLRSRYGDRVAVVYKHYPLSTACNGRLARDLQPGACEVAWAAQAAHRQGSFWRFHDALFAAGPHPAGEIVADAARRVGVDPTRLAADRESAAIKAHVARDIALGNELKLPGTPSVILDGRLVTSPRLEILDILIRHELDRPVAGSPRSISTSSSRSRHGGGSSKGG